MMAASVAHSNMSAQLPGVMMMALSEDEDEDEDELSSAARIVVVDDHPMVREGLRGCLSHEPEFTLCGEAEDETSGMQLVRSELPQLVITDLSLKSGHGIDLARRIRTELPDIRVLILSMHDDVLYAERALRAGANGYINKQEPRERLIEAIRMVLAGGIYLGAEMTQRILSRLSHSESGADPIQQLTDRELQVFQLIGQGQTTREIAQALNRSIHTIETHREKIKRKLDLTSANDLVQQAVQWVMEQGP